MALVHEFEKNGNWLFKRRGWLPLFIFLPSLAYVYLSGAEAMKFRPGIEITCLGISLTGLVIRAITVGRTPKGTSGRNVNKQVADTLNTSGIYSVVRHPLYVGNFFMWLGPVLWLRSVWIAVIFCLLYWLYYERIMFAEEQFLRRKFADKYDEWASGVKAFLPSFNNYRKSELPFSLRNVLKREYNGFGTVFLVFAVLDLVRNIALNQEIRLNLLWAVLMGCGLIIWIVLRTLKKFTARLDVKGR